MSAELGLAIVATIDLCLRYGKDVTQLCKSFKNADIELEERLLRLDVACLRCMSQLNFLRQMQHLAEESHLLLQERILHVLVGKLEIAKSIVKRLVTMASENATNGAIVLVPKRLQFSINKATLDEAIEAVETWQKIADPSWFLLLRMTDRQIDSALQQHGGSTVHDIPSTLAVRASVGLSSSTLLAARGLSLSIEAINQMTVLNVDYTNARFARNTTGVDASCYILDAIVSCGTSNYHIEKQNVRELARRLQTTEPENFNLLSCKGFVTDKTIIDGMEQTMFSLVFRVPRGMGEPFSLRHLLLSRPMTASLSHRFEIARQLANAICYVHTFGFVHKAVQPENILCFIGSESKPPFVSLIGFDQFRKEGGRTSRIGDDALHKNLYRHPFRQGPNPRQEYIMQHDIYSLGACLLEIGLWQTFVRCDEHGKPISTSAYLNLSIDSSTSEIQLYKDRYLLLARAELPKVMGTRYAEVVETCLTCLDPGNAEFGDPKEFEDEDGIRVAVRYIEKVLHKLTVLYV